MITIETFCCLYTLAETETRGMTARDLQERLHEFYPVQISALYMRMKRAEQDGLVRRTYVESRTLRAGRPGAATEVCYVLTLAGQEAVNDMIRFFDLPTVEIF